MGKRNAFPKTFNTGKLSKGAMREISKDLKEWLDRYLRVNKHNKYIQWNPK